MGWSRATPSHPVTAHPGSQTNPRRWRSGAALPMNLVWKHAPPAVASEGRSNPLHLPPLPLQWALIRRYAIPIDPPRLYPY